jgi:hypothetical protein
MEGTRVFDDKQGQFIAGTNAALMNIIALLADEMTRQGAFEKAGLVARIVDLTAKLEVAPDSAHQFRDQTIVAQLKAFLQLLEFEPKPRWEPRVIE